MHDTYYHFIYTAYGEMIHDVKMQSMSNMKHDIE